MKIKAAVIHKAGDPFVIEEVELAEPRDNEILVKIVACGVCHTDESERQGRMTPFPVVLGHEGAGIVEKVGKDVKDFEVGDHVTMSYASCHECSMCNKGKNWYCERSNELCFKGHTADYYTPLAQGDEKLNLFFGQSSFATYATVDARNAVKVDKDVDLRIIGPLGCGIETGAGAVLNHCRPDEGDTIVIFGTGGVGLSAIMAAKVAKCSKIIAVDVFDSRLELAKECGATDTINSKVITDVVAEVKKITDGKGTHFAVDTTGLDFIVKQALLCMRPGGVGCGVAQTQHMEFESWTAHFIAKSWTALIMGEALPQTFIPQMIEYYKQGLFPFDKMIKFFKFSEINEAFEASHNGSVIKPVLLMEE